MSRAATTPGQPMSERQVQDAIAATARALGYKVAHFRTAQTKRGAHVTPVAYDAKGYPDLTICAGSCVAFVEVKARNGRVRPEQDEWLRALSAAGCPTLVAWPEDYLEGRVEVWLRGLNAKGIAA